MLIHPHPAVSVGPLILVGGCLPFPWGWGGQHNDWKEEGEDFPRHYAAVEVEEFGTYTCTAGMGHSLGILLLHSSSHSRPPTHCPAGLEGGSYETAGCGRVLLWHFEDAEDGCLLRTFSTGQAVVFPPMA